MLALLCFPHGGLINPLILTVAIFDEILQAKAKLEIYLKEECFSK